MRDVPRQAAKNLSCKEHLNIDGEKGEEDEQGHPNQGKDHCLVVSETIGENAIEHQAKNFARDGGIGEARLPRGRYLIISLTWRRFWVQRLAIGAPENWEGIKAVDEGQVVTLHDDGHAQDQGP